MNNLTIKQINIGGEIIPVVDSREVAEMLGKEHSELLKEIEGRKDKKNVGIIPTLEKGKFHVSKYFILDTYISGTREYKCYQVTKIGCELLGNKQQGEKGILFTAKYVEAFNEMEKLLAPRPKLLTAKEELKLHYEVLEDHEEKINKIDNKIDNLENNMPLFNVECKELQALVRKKGIEVLGGKGRQAYKDNSLRGKVYSDIQQQLRREFQITRYEAIKRSQLNIAKEIVKTYKAPLVLSDEIMKINNQLSFVEGI